MAKFTCYDESSVPLGITIQRCSDDLYLAADGTWAKDEPISKPIPMVRDEPPRQFRVRAVVASDDWLTGSYLWTAWELNADGSARRAVGAFMHGEMPRLTLSNMLFGYSVSKSG